MLSTNFWKKYFQVYDVLNLVIPYQELMDEIIKQADVKDGDLILDAGCGTGNFEFWLRQMRPKVNAKVVGVAHSPDGLEIYRKKIPKAEVKIVDLIEKLPFTDNYFNQVVSNNVLFTIDPKKRTDIFREFYRVLKPGGIIVVSNLCCNWAPYNVYREHLKLDRQKNGFSSSMSLAIKKIMPTLKVFYYNFLLENEGNYGDYRYMDDGEQARKLTKIGFKNISEDKYVYAGQGILNRAVK